MTFNGFYLLNWKYFSLSTLTVGVLTYPPTLALTSVLGFLFPHTMDSGGQLNGGKRLSIIGRGVRDVSNHGCPTVDVPQGISQ